MEYIKKWKYRTELITVVFNDIKHKIYKYNADNNTNKITKNERKTAMLTTLEMK